MKEKYLILDCFVDEPACLGVPPFVSPYPRYIYGALLDAGIDEELISYKTIDFLRERNFELDQNYSMVFLIGGAVVPGKYLGYEIGKYSEIIEILKKNSSQKFAIGGLISHFLKNEEIQNAICIIKDIEKFANSFASGDPKDTLRDYSELNRWAVLGAKVVKKHPEFPDLIAEIETYRGCPREKHCSFCSEFIFKDIPFRDQSDILSEVDTLIECGISRFRIGRQADIIAYKSKKIFRNGFPEPSPDEVSKLFSMLKERRDSGKIRTLNIDNANPGTIFNFQNESRTILEAITEALTEGDTIPLGVESFDPKVKELNSLKIAHNDLIEVVKIINEIGGVRRNGIPVLLPGINLIQGLTGEDDKTFQKNYDALKKIMDMGLLVKRINIRKLSPFPGTEISDGKKNKSSQKLLNRYEFYKEKIRKEIDHHMLSRIYPAGTILRDVRIEDIRFDYSYGKQIASYAITSKLPLLLPTKSVIDTVVIDQRERSLITLPYPIKINEIPQKAIELLPGVSRNLSSQIIIERPFNSKEEIKKIAPNLKDEVLERVEVSKA